MVNNGTGVTRVEELDGASICVTTGTTSEHNLEDFFRGKGMKYTAVKNSHPDLSIMDYSQGRCDAFSGDKTSLYGHRLKLANPDGHRVLKDVIAKEPLGPVVAHGDDQ